MYVRNYKKKNYKKLLIIFLAALSLTILLLFLFTMIIEKQRYKTERSNMSKEDIKIVNEVIELAKEKEGLEYLWGGKGELVSEERLNELIGYYGESYYPLSKEQYIGKQGFDCSGLTYWCYFKITGKEIGYSTVQQQEKLKDYKVSIKDLRPGDIIFTPGHVVLYIGEGKIINSANKNKYPKGGVKVEGIGLNRFGEVYRPLEYIKSIKS